MHSSLTESFPGGWASSSAGHEPAGRGREGEMPSVAVLAWDSLPMAEGALPFPRSGWREGGPELPVEIAHLTPDLVLLAVLCRGAPTFPVIWCVLETASAAEAVWALARVYGARPEDIGYVDLEGGGSWCRTVDEKVPEIKKWAESLPPREGRPDLVIWNDLRPNFSRKTRMEPTGENLLRFALRLPEEKRSRLISYLRDMPACIDTPLRRELLERLG